MARIFPGGFRSFGDTPVKKILLVWAALLVCVAGLRAQVANNTSLVGTVVDASGSAVVGATVTAVEESTKIKSTVVTNTSGYYAVTFIQPGTYDITVTQQGFKKITKTGVIVPVDRAVRTDFSLAVGSEDATVVVTADTPPLSTDDSTLGETFSQKAVESLPLSGHNAMDLATMASNVYVGSKTSYQGNPPGEDLQGAGQREINNSITLDGISVLNDLITTTPAHPASDMVSEVQMQSGNYPAQYGGYLGIHVNMVSKHGTNQLHGSAYDYIENTALNAFPFTATAGSKKPVLHSNQYGGTVGGPVFLPKLYDGRNRTFFFGSYEKLNTITEGSGYSSVLTPDMESGNFAAICSVFDANGLCTTGTQIYDPTTGNPYPNNQIPSSQLNTDSANIAKAYEQYMVAPNLPGISNNLYLNYPSNLVIKQTLDRVDENIGENVKLFFRFYWQNLTFLSGTAFPANASSGPTNQRNYAFGYTHILSPRLVNDFHFGVNKLIAANLNYWYVNGLKDAGTQLGIPGFTGDTQYNNPGVPVLSISNFQGVGNAGSNWFQDNRSYTLYDQLSYTHGSHQIMAGFELRRITLGRQATNNPGGAINFAASTVTPGVPGVSTGYAAADFVLGYVNNATTPINSIKGSVEEWRDGFFILDNWQVTPKLTLNMGLRYDLPLGATSLNGYGRMLNEDQSALIPESNCPSGTACSGGTWKPTPGFQFTPAQKDNIGPRLGLAYRATNKLVVRAGGGFYYNPNQLNTYTLLTANYPFSAAVTYNTTNANPLTFESPTAGAGTASPIAGTPGTYVFAYTPERNMPTQRAYQWNLDAGYSLWNGAALEAQYQGSRSLHLDRSFYNNQPTSPVNTSILSLNKQRPNQLWGDIRTFQEDGWSSYNALNVILRQRTYHGLSGQIGYTWAHTLDLSPDSNGGGTLSQQYNPAADYGNANWDIRNRVTAVFTYELPNFRQSNVLTRQVLGGWQLSGVVNFQSGTPFNISMGSNTTAAGVGQGTQRPSWVHGEKASCSLKSAYKGYVSSGTSCIDTSAYKPAVNYSDASKPVGFGDLHRNSLIGPGFQYENLAIIKSFPIYEKVTFQFRSQAYNVFNHPSGSNPSSGGIGISTSGACATDACLTFPNGFGVINGVQQVPGTFSGARVLELSGKLIF